MLDRRTLAKGAVALGAGLGLSTTARPLTHLAQAQEHRDAPRRTEPPPTLALTNGQWFDGTGFVPTTMYTEGGVFREQAPATIDQTIDLEGNFVIPPLGDAHIHWMAGPGTEEFFASVIAADLAVGEFYVLDLGGIPAFSPTSIHWSTPRPASISSPPSNAGPASAATPSWPTPNLPRAGPSGFPSTSSKAAPISRSAAGPTSSATGRASWKPSRGS